MADYSKYLDVLAKEASDNSYNSFGGIADSLSGSVLQSAGQPGANLGESLLYGSILGLLGGGLGQLGQNQADEDMLAAKDILLGNVTEQPSTLSNPLYNKSRAYRDLIVQDQQDAKLERLAKRDDFLFEKKAGLDPYGIDVLGRETGAGDANFLKPQDAAKIGRVDDLIDAFDKSPEIVKFNSTHANVDATLKALKDPQATADVEIAPGVQLAIEPGLAVRTDDREAQRFARSLTGTLKSKVIKYLTGESELDDDVREGFARIIKRRYQAQRDSIYDKKMNNIIKLGEARNLTKDDIFPTGGLPTLAEMEAEAEAYGEQFKAPQIDITDPNVIAELRAARARKMAQSYGG